MVHLDLATEEAAVVRAILLDKLKALSTEINRTDHVTFKEELRKTRRVVERLVGELDAGIH